MIRPLLAALAIALPLAAMAQVPGSLLAEPLRFLFYRLSWHVQEQLHLLDAQIRLSHAVGQQAGQSLPRRDLIGILLEPLNTLLHQGKGVRTA